MRRETATNWQVSAIQTLLFGAPFLRPSFPITRPTTSNTHNPVHLHKSNFPGSIIEGGPNQYFNPNVFLQPLPGTYGNADETRCRAESLKRTSPCRRISLTERLGLQFRAEIFDFVQPSELQYAEPRGVRGRHWRSFANSRRNHVHCNKLAPGANWIEAVVVSSGFSGLKHDARKIETLTTRRYGLHRRALNL